MTVNNKNWDTTFNTARGLMIHDFEADVKVVTDMEKNSIAVYKDGHVVRTLGIYSDSKEYIKFLESISSDVEKLKNFKA